MISLKYGNKSSKILMLELYEARATGDISAKKCFNIFSFFDSFVIHLKKFKIYYSIHHESTLSRLRQNNYVDIGIFFVVVQLLKKAD